MKIAIASCCKLQQCKTQPVWDEIRAEKPDALLLLGDTIYLNHDRHTDAARLGQELRACYQEQFRESHFHALLEDLAKREAPLIAIYDDHDFLGNNRYGGEHDPALREAARAEFIRTFKAPANADGDVFRHVPLKGVDIIVLDERYYRTAPSISGASRDAILGARQWEWLEQTFAACKANYVMIASSSTYHTYGDESWEQYPGAFARMRELLKGRKGAFIASGDVHRNDLYDDSGVLEIVTSAVARNGILFGSPRKNYGILEFSPQSMHVQLRSLKAGWRFDVKIPLDPWSLDTTTDAADTQANVM